MMRLVARARRNAGVVLSKVYQLRAFYPTIRSVWHYEKNTAWVRGQRRSDSAGTGFSSGLWDNLGAGNERHRMPK